MQITEPCETETQTIVYLAHQSGTFILARRRFSHGGMVLPYVTGSAGAQRGAAAAQQVAAGAAATSDRTQIDDAVINGCRLRVWVADGTGSVGEAVAADEFGANL